MYQLYISERPAYNLSTNHPGMETRYNVSITATNTHIYKQHLVTPKKQKQKEQLRVT